MGSKKHTKKKTSTDVADTLKIHNVYFILITGFLIIITIISLIHIFTSNYSAKKSADMNNNMIGRAFFNGSSPSQLSCTDSDSGADIYLNGITQSSNSNRVIKDTCLSNNSLVEGQCVNGFVKRLDVICARGCVNGHCISQDPYCENSQVCNNQLICPKSGTTNTLCKEEPVCTYCSNGCNNGVCNPFTSNRTIIIG